MSVRFAFGIIFFLMAWPMSSERLLHPVSVLFRLGDRLRELVIPVIVLFFVSRSRAGLGQLALPAIVVAISTIAAAVQHFSFRYRYGEGELVLRWGIFFRKQRHIPYDKIQNIDAVQSVVHRLFGVVSIVVQTGSGTEPEATLSVLPLSALEEMRAHVFAGRGVPAVALPLHTAEAVAAGTADRVLLHLAPADLMLAGFIENRGMTVILAAAGFLSQIDSARDWLGGKLYLWLPEVIRNEAIATSMTANGVTGILAAAIAVILALLLFVRVMSTLWALARLYDFKLTRRDEDLRAEYGLFTHVTATIPIKRIQTISVQETLLHRRLGRAAVRVTTAGGGAGQSGNTEREWVAPIVRRERLAGLLQELYPGLVLDNLDWRRAHPRAAARMARRSTLWIVPFALASGYVIGWWAVAVGLVLMVSAIARARLQVKYLGWSLAPAGVVFRAGGLRRTTTAAPFARVQAVEFTESPFDRRSGMAEVTVDTAGRSAGELGMSYLPRGNAIELRDLVAAQSSSTAFTW